MLLPLLLLSQKPNAPSRLLLMAPPTTVQVFVGSAFGVSAQAQLDMQTRVAHVKLSGLAIGGVIEEGDGWLNDNNAECGSVVLDPQLKATLARRFVTIQRASLDRSAKTVTVYALVPVFGTVEIVLEAAAASAEGT